MAVTITITVQETGTGIQTEISAKPENSTMEESLYSAVVLELIDGAIGATGGKKEVMLGDNTNVH